MKPELAFRVGVTGSRKAEEAGLPVVRAQVEAVLAQVRQAVHDTAAAMSREPSDRQVYRAEPHGVVKPRLRVLSPLADGADRLVADVATGLGYGLDVALPFAREVYAEDFLPESRADFERRLDGLAKDAACLVIDGARDADKSKTDVEERSYEAVGRLVVRNCDLLVAIWNGYPAKGPAGTGEIVRFAARFGPPVWWIDATGRVEPRLIRSTHDLRRPETAPCGAAAREALAKLLQKALVPPRAHPSHAHGIIGGLARGLSISGHEPADPLQTYLAEERLPERWLWRAYRWAFDLVAGRPPAKRGQQETKPAVGFWERQYQPADSASIAYGDRYRSSYVLVFGLATLAVFCAVLSLAYPPVKVPMSLLELVALVAIMILVALNKRHEWHGRWIAYRLLAELCRKQEALARLGWSLPASDLRRIGGESAPAPWVGWYFNALLRAAPLATGTLGGDNLARIRDRVCAELISGQTQYHRKRKRESARAGRRLAQLGEIFFLLTLLIVAKKLILIPVEELHSLVVGLGVVAAILPALSAAFVGIRAYAELELLEEQSARMEAIMAEADRWIGLHPLDRPLSSQELGADVLELSAEMLRDVGGWADLFHLKAVEAG